MDGRGDGLPLELVFVDKGISSPLLFKVSDIVRRNSIPPSSTTTADSGRQQQNFPSAEMPKVDEESEEESKVNTNRCSSSSSSMQFIYEDNNSSDSFIEDRIHQFHSSKLQPNTSLNSLHIEQHLPPLNLLLPQPLDTQAHDQPELQPIHHNDSTHHSATINKQHLPPPIIDSHSNSGEGFKPQTIQMIIVKSCSPTQQKHHHHIGDDKSLPQSYRSSSHSINSKQSLDTSHLPCCCFPSAPLSQTSPNEGLMRYDDYSLLFNQSNEDNKSHYLSGNSFHEQPPQEIIPDRRIPFKVVINSTLSVLQKQQRQLNNILIKPNSSRVFGVPISPQRYQKPHPPRSHPSSKANSPNRTRGQGFELIKTLNNQQQQQQQHTLSRSFKGKVDSVYFPSSLQKQRLSSSFHRRSRYMTVTEGEKEQLSININDDSYSRRPQNHSGERKSEVTPRTSSDCYRNTNLRNSHHEQQKLELPKSNSKQQQHIHHSQQVTLDRQSDERLPEIFHSDNHSSSSFERERRTTYRRRVKKQSSFTRDTLVPSSRWNGSSTFQSGSGGGGGGGGGHLMRTLNDCEFHSFEKEEKEEEEDYSAQSFIDLSSSNIIFTPINSTYDAAAAGKRGSLDIIRRGGGNRKSKIFNNTANCYRLAAPSFSGSQMQQYQLLSQQQLQQQIAVEKKKMMKQSVNQKLKITESIYLRGNTVSTVQPRGDRHHVLMSTLTGGGYPKVMGTPREGSIKQPQQQQSNVSAITQRKWLNTHQQTDNSKKMDSHRSNKQKDGLLRQRSRSPVVAENHIKARGNDAEQNVLKTNLAKQKNQDKLAEEFIQSSSRVLNGTIVPPIVRRTTAVTPGSSLAGHKRFYEKTHRAASEVRTRLSTILK